MCGGFGLLLTVSGLILAVLSLFVEQLQKAPVLTIAGVILFSSTGILCLLYACFDVWKDRDKEARVAEERLRPMLELAGVRVAGPGEDHYRVIVRNLSGGRVQFKTQVRLAEPALEGGFPLPVDLQPTHSQSPDSIGEAGPNGEQPVDVFVYRRRQTGYLEDVVEGKARYYPLMEAGTLALKLMGNPPRLHPISMERAQELLVGVYAVSDEGGLDERWFCIDPQPDGTIEFTAGNRPNPASGGISSIEQRTQKHNPLLIGLRRVAYLVYVRLVLGRPHKKAKAGTKQFTQPDRSSAAQEMSPTPPSQGPQ